MSLTPAESDAAFRFLVDALRQAGLSWVVTQVEEKLALGKVHEKRIRSREMAEPSDRYVVSDGPQRAAKTGAAIFTVSEGYSLQERLHVLLDAIELAVPVLNAVAATAFSNLAAFGVSGGIEFAPEADVSDPFSLDAATIQERDGATHRLAELLAELRREVGDAN